MIASYRNDAATQRRLQLKRWIDDLFEGSQAAFIASTNDGTSQVNQGELSGLLKAKSFGEKRARRLEQQAGMPDGYLDATTAPSATGQDHARIHQAQEPLPGTVAIARGRAIVWPFHQVSYSRLMDLKRSLGPKAASEAIRELDRLLDAMVTKLEREATEKKKKSNDS
jgi:hypothetical protein